MLVTVTLAHRSKQLLIRTTLLKVPQLILWMPLCLCPCAKRLRLLPLAHIPAKYWRLLVETRPVKTIWEETSFSGDYNRAKQNHRQCGGIRTQPNLPTSTERTEHQKEEGNGQIVSKKRRGQRRQGEDREDVNTEICTAWLVFPTRTWDTALIWMYYVLKLVIFHVWMYVTFCYVMFVNAVFFLLSFKLLIYNHFPQFILNIQECDIIDHMLKIHSSNGIVIMCGKCDSAYGWA